VLNGLLYHETDLRIEEHYTDTAGFTDHLFALCHLLGFRFAPRIRDLADKRLYSIVPSTEDGIALGYYFRNSLRGAQMSSHLVRQALPGERTARRAPPGGTGKMPVPPVPPCESGEGDWWYRLPACTPRLYLGTRTLSTLNFQLWVAGGARAGSPP
jgi:hypothetical protein